jgi:aspartate/methionine/tyrosine aminotransferase
MDALHGAAVYILGATNTVAQAGAQAAFEDDRFIEKFSRTYERRRRFAHEVFNTIPGVHCLLPESSFLLWLNIAALGSSNEVAQYLVEDARVAVNSGARYGEYGEGYLRITLGSLSSEAAFEEAIERMALSLRRLAAKLELSTDEAVDSLARSQND